jgi:hypothetical protein
MTAGLGYSAGKTLADLIDEQGNVKKQPSSVDRFLDPVGETAIGYGMMERGDTLDNLTRPVRDAITGTGMGAAGDVAARGVTAIPRIGRGVIDWFKGSKALSREGAERTAGQYLMANTSEGPIYARNAQEAREIEDIINAGAGEGEPLFRFSTAQRSFDPNMVKAERAAVLPQGHAANMKVEQDAINSEALRRFYQRNFGGTEGTEDVLSALTSQRALGQAAEDTAKEAAGIASQRVMANATEPQTAGGQIIKDIKEAKKPVQAALETLEKDIPDYPMQFNNTFKKISDIIKDPSASDLDKEIARNVKDRIERIIKESGASTKTAMGINRTLNGLSKTAYQQNRPVEGRFLTKIKQEGLQADIDAVSTTARRSTPTKSPPTSSAT